MIQNLGKSNLGRVLAVEGPFFAMVSNTFQLMLAVTVQPAHKEKMQSHFGGNLWRQIESCMSIIARRSPVIVTMEPPYYYSSSRNNNKA